MTMMKVLSIKKLQALLEKLSDYGDPVIICWDGGNVTVKKPWNQTAKG